MTVEYPPLTSLHDVPLHPDIGEPYACIGGPHWDWRCHQCVHAAERLLAAGQDPPMSVRFSRTTAPVGVRLSYMVERSRALLGPTK